MAHTTSLHRIAGKIAEAGLDFIFPPRCLACGQDVDRAGGVCGACWRRLTFIIAPQCACCGLPFDYDPGIGALCGACAGAAPAYDTARAALAYDAASRPLLVGLKHDRLHGVRTLATWMRRAAAETMADAGLICPVPLHRWRLLKRGYNQAALLAGALATQTGIEAVPDILLRRRATASQGGLSRSGRSRNVRGAFAVNPRWLSRVSGAIVILVDDVYTTGATLGECCRVLQRAGAAEIHVVCAARVLTSVVRG